jgi:hypothetical protein
MFRYAFVTLLLIASFAGEALADTVQIVPPSPRYFEPVYLRLTLPPNDSTFVVTGNVSMQGSTITVNYVTNVDFPSTQATSFTLLLGKFPAGTYTVVANAPLGSSALQFNVTPKPAEDDSGGAKSPVIDFTGHWWNPNESGWGLVITQGPTNDIFAEWFVYDSAGNPTWYSLQPGSWNGTDIYSGPIYRVTGPYYRNAFDPSAVQITQVGTGTLEFLGLDNASGLFVYTIDGIQSSKHIERLSIE